MFYHEVRKEVKRVGEPIVVEVGEIVPPSEYNFRSTFDWPESIANFVKNTGRTAGLKGQPVSCAEIFIDIDEEDSVLEAKEIMLNLGIEFDEYRTGNRGIHFHIPLEERITGTNVIYTVTSWIKDVGLWHLVDTSVYREAGLFRMETATHQKTGKPKVLVEEHYGKRLRLELKDKPPIQETEVIAENGTKYNFFLNLLQKRSEGGRHMHMFICHSAGRSAGIDKPTIDQAIKEWNRRLDNPHPERVVEQKLKGFK
jgi:hypothetical protein